MSKVGREVSVVLSPARFRCIHHMGKTRSAADCSGMWSATPSAAYMTYDVVQMGSGTSSGMYLSLIDTNTSAPDSGYGWTQVSSSAGTLL